MTNLQEVPTEELLSFQDYPSVHNPLSNTTIPISAVQNIPPNPQNDFQDSPMMQASEDLPKSPESGGAAKTFWTIEYYQKFFDVDTREVLDRIIASITPRWNNSLKHHLRVKPDLYGPFWISVTLIFTIAISGNIANYLQHANAKYHWKYDFHLVSIAATTICLYVTLVPSILWGLLKWSTQINDIEGLDSDDHDVTPGVLELICIYGYSLFIYIPVSVLWSIQIEFLQWILVLFGTFISGSVLLLTVMPALRLSKHKLLLSIGILLCHLLLAAGFKMYFFHDPGTTIVHMSPEVVHQIVNDSKVLSNINATAKAV